MALLDQIPSGGRVLLIRLRSLGDCVLTTPAIHILEQYRPDIEIAVMVEDRFREVYKGNPDVDEILPPSHEAGRRFRPHLALDLHGGSRSARLAFRHYSAGYGAAKFGWTYDVTIPTAERILGVPGPLHTAEAVASTIFHLGARRMEIPRARLFAPPPVPRKSYAVIHAFAREPDMQWGADRFVEAARHMRRNLGLTPVFIGSPNDDFSPFAEFETRGGDTLEQTKSLLSAASLFLGNDSGPAHMAAAFGVPVVVLFRAREVHPWTPWRTVHETLVAEDVRQQPVRAVLEAIDRVAAS